MSDKLERLEAELAAMRPRALPAGLTNRIEAGLAAPLAAANPWPDRFLLSAIGSGAIAACVVVGMLLKPATPPFDVPSPVVAVAKASDPPRAGDYSLVIARAEFGP